MAIFANGVVFVIVYVLAMIPTYYMPYAGSNSLAVNALGNAFNQGPNPALLWHVGAFVVLIGITWARGSLIGKKWLGVFPILALVFDFVPGLSLIPMIPTIMHLLAIILGVASTKAVA